jgi:Tfp pilus assembly protein PilF
MSQYLEDLLQQCTVKLTILGVSQGTGFFVSPGLILTCAHVVKDLGNKSIQVRWQNQENWAQAVVERSIPDPHDLALLRVVSLIEANPPCVFLDAKVPNQRAPLYLFGYPDKDFPNGCPVTFDYEGLTGDNPALIKFKSGLVRPGMSGSPLLNQRTGDVCGIVKFTLDRSSVRGGGAIPTSVILNQFPELVEKQIYFHQHDRRWNNLAKELFDDEDEMRQNNFDNTSNYQVQTGVNRNNIIGGEHQHYYSSSQEKQIARKILMLSANPENTAESSKRTGLKEIRDALKRSNYSQLLEIQERLDTSAADISQVLSELQPYIVNISGDEDGIDSLTLANISGENIFKNREELIANLFQYHSKNIKCIILNGCFSIIQAREIIRYVEFIIGISQNLKNSTVINFLAEFYYQVGSQRTIRDAYYQSCNFLERTGTTSDLLPVLLNQQEEARRVKLEEELKLCDIAIKNNRYNVSSWIEKASLLTKLARLSEADEAYEQASLLQPRNPDFKTRQGDILKKSGNYEGAIVAYEKALEIEKDDYKVWWKKGQSLAKIKKYFEAVRSYDRAIELNPPYPDSYIIFRQYGFILNQLSQYQESIIQYKKSLGVEPRHRLANYKKRQVYKKMYSVAN